MDDEDLFADETPALEGTTAYPFPQYVTGGQRAAAPRRRVWDPYKGAGGKADLTGFMTVDQFFDDPRYKQAPYAEKKELEKRYQQRFLTKPVTMALGGNIDDLTSGIEYFKSRAAVDERKNDSWLDTDWFDMAARGLASAVGGAARVIGEAVDSDTLRALSDRASEDVKRIERENFSATTRYANEEEAAADRRLAEEYGGKENIPWYKTLKQEFSNFTARPVAKLAETVGTSLPVLGAAAVAGPAGAVAASSALVAGDAGGGAYDAVMALPDDVLARNPEYQALMDAGFDPVSARQRLASSAALEGGAYGAVIGAISGTISAKIGAASIVSKKFAGTALNPSEKKVVGIAEHGILNKLRAVGGEALSEFLEEGLTQVAQNRAIQAIDPAQSLTEDALKAATAGALAGGALGGTSHLLPSNSDAAPPTTGDTNGTQQPPPAAPPADESPPPEGPVDPAPPAGPEPTDEPVPPSEPGGDVGDAPDERGGSGQPPGGTDGSSPPEIAPRDLFTRAGDLQQILDMPEGEERENALATFPNRPAVQAEIDRYQTEFTTARDTLATIGTADRVISDVNGFVLDSRPDVPYAGTLNGALGDLVDQHLESQVLVPATKEIREAVRTGLSSGQLVTSTGVLFENWTKKDFQNELGNQLLGTRLDKFADYVAARATDAQVRQFASAVKGSSNEDMRFVGDVLEERLRGDNERLKDEAREQMAELERTPAKSATALRNKLLSFIGRDTGQQAGDSSEQLSERAMAALRDGDAWTALRDIAINNKARNVRLIATKMLSLQDKVTVAVTTLPEGTGGLHYLTNRHALREYPNLKVNKNAKYGVVLISTSHQTVHTFIHEMAHAYTRASMMLPSTPEQKKALADVTVLLEKAKKAAKDRGLLNKKGPGWAVGRHISYGLTAPVEFVAEAFSNPLFQEFLLSIPDSTLTKDNLLTRFSKIIAKLFGIDNLHARTMIVIDQLVNEKLGEKDIEAKYGNRLSADTARPASDARTEVRSGDQERGAGGRRESDNRGVSVADQAASATARETGTAHGNGNPYTEGPPSAGVANAVAELPDADRVALEAAASTVGLTGADLAQAARNIAVDIGPDEAREAFSFDDATRAAMMKIPMPPKLQSAVDTFIEQTGKIQTWDQMTDLMTKGIAPTTNRFGGWTDRYIEKFIDSAQPFAKMLRRGNMLLQDNPLWRLFKVAGSKYENGKVEVNRDVRAVNKLLTQLAKQTGLDPKTFFLMADQYTLAMYVVTGANDELKAKHEKYLADLTAEINKLMAQQNAATNPRDIARIEALIDAANRRGLQSRAWLQRFDEVNNVVRKPPGTLRPDGSEDPEARRESDKFVGGLTFAEAFAMMNNGLVKTHQAQFVQAQQAIVKLQKAWATKAVQAGIFNPDETAKWSQNPNYVPTTGDPDAESDVYQTGGTTSRDFVRSGRSTFADGGFMATIQQASNFARRIAFKEFYDELAKVGRDSNNPYGITTMAQDAPSSGSIAFATKVWDPSTKTTIQQKIVFDDQAAAGSLIGKNRTMDDSLALKMLSDFTSIFGRAVTQYTLAFGPVNYVRDLGEKAFTLLSSIPGIDKGRFIRSVARSIFSMPDLYAAWKFSAGQTLNTPSFKLLQQLSDNGGLNTRTGSLSRDVDRIVTEMRRTDGWREIAHRVGDFVHNYNNMFEIAASLAVYRALGESTNGAVETNAFRVLNTMNFGQSGTKSPIFRAFYTFFNPTAQGALNVARGVKSLQTKQGRGVLLGTALAYGFLYALARGLSGDDDDDQTGNRMDSLADASLARSIPLFAGDDAIIKIPVPFGIQTALWASIVSAGRLASGRFDPGEAAAFALQGTAEQMAPFPLSRVDITQNPAFWAAKSLTPQWGQLILNIAADKNDFGGKLTREFIQGDQPVAMQGKRGTPGAYKEAASGLFSATGIDIAPEQLQETLKFVALGPLGAAIEGFLKDEERSGVPTELMVAQGLTGSNRLVGIDTKEVDRSYYERMERVYTLYKRGHGQAPRGSENGRREPLDDWLARTQLSDAQQQLIIRFSEADKALKAARRGGASAADEKAIMREFLRDTKDLK